MNALDVASQVFLMYKCVAANIAAKGLLSQVHSFQMPLHVMFCGKILIADFASKLFYLFVNSLDVRV